MSHGVSSFVINPGSPVFNFSPDRSQNSRVNGTVRVISSDLKPYDCELDVNVWNFETESDRYLLHY